MPASRPSPAPLLLRAVLRKCVTSRTRSTYGDEGCTRRVGYREWLLGLRRAVLLRLKAEELDFKLRGAKMTLRKQIGFYSQVRKISSTPPRMLTKEVRGTHQITLTNSGVRYHLAKSSSLSTKGQPPACKGKRPQAIPIASSAILL